MSNKFYKAIRAGDLVAIKQLLEEGTKLDEHAWFIAVKSPENIQVFEMFSQHIQLSKESKNKKKEAETRPEENNRSKMSSLKRVYYPLDLVSYVDSNLPLFWYAIAHQQWSLVSWFLTIENNDFHYTPGTQCFAEYSVTNLNKIITELAGIIGPANTNDPEWLQSFFLHGLLVWCAAHKEQLNLVQLLLTRLPTKLSFFCPDIYSGQTVLWHAARNNRWDIVYWLLKNDSDNSLSYQSGCEGQSLTWLAAYHSQWEYVEYFLSLSFDDINSYPSGKHEGRSILWCAAHEDQWDIVEKILNQDNVYIVDVWPAEHPGKTVLWLAARFGKWSTVKLILERFPEVDINAHPLKPTVEDFLPQASILQFAEWSSELEVVAMLKQHQSEQQAIDLDNKHSSSSELIKSIDLFIEKNISQFAGADEAPFLQKKLQQAFKTAAIDLLDVQCPPEYSTRFFKKDKLTEVQEKIMHVLGEVNLFEVEDDVLVEKMRAMFHPTHANETFTP